MTVRVADLAEKVRLISAQTPMSDLVQLLLSETDCEWLTVVQDRKPAGLISRSAVMELSASSTDAALSVLTVGEFVPKDVFRINGDLPAAQVALEHQRDDYQKLRGGAMVTQGRRYLGVVTLPQLLKAVAMENAARAKAMKQDTSVPEPAEETPAPSADTPTNVKDTQYLLATLAHEVRTPLTGMMGLAEMLAGRLQDPETRDIAETIVRSGDTLDRILKDTLDYVSLESGKININPEPADLTDLVNDLRRLWSVQSSRRGLALHVGFTPNGPHRVSVDLGRVRQVVNNLVSNALKFTRQGGVSVTIGTQPLGQGLMLSVEVADTGRGIAGSDKERFFRAFEKGQIPEDAPGWGLGLTISHSLARHLGGQLSLADNPGGGAVFTLMIPVTACETKPVKPTRTLKSGRFSLGEVLVIEDHEACAMVVISALEKAGWVVQHTSSLAQAEEMLSAQSFQAILTDLHLIDGSALTLIDSIRQCAGPNADTPILAMTADITAGTRQACLAMGADRALSKPIQGPALVATLADVLMARAAGDLSVPQLRGRIAS